MLNGFAAIVPAAASPAIGDLAAKCTTIFDAFRAPMAAQERARRVASGLNQGQIANLDRWAISTGCRFQISHDAEQVGST